MSKRCINYIRENSQTAVDLYKVISKSKKKKKKRLFTHDAKRFTITFLEKIIVHGASPLGLPSIPFSVDDKCSLILVQSSVFKEIFSPFSRLDIVMIWSIRVGGVFSMVMIQ